MFLRHLSRALLVATLAIVAAPSPALGQDKLDRQTYERGRKVLEQIRKDLREFYYDTTYKGLDLDARAPLVFVAHLLPTVRGILATLHVSFTRPMRASEIEGLFHQAYEHAPFVRVRKEGDLPELRHVVGTPRAEIGFVLLNGGRRAVIVSVIDNLLKGAASQAVQNFNRVHGFDETEALA